jgi:hypothetical protein
MRRRQLWLERLKQVEREFLAARSSLRLLEEKLKADPCWGEEEGWYQSDATSLFDNHEPTYLIRLYAEFESGLRDFWSRGLKRASHPKMQDLLISIASQRISKNILDDADGVRKLRNSFVHPNPEADVEPVPLNAARHRLCRFLSRLPLDW